MHELSEYGKSLAALVWAILVVVEQTFGFSFGIGEHQVTDIIAVLSPIAVWFMPGK